MYRVRRSKGMTSVGSPFGSSNNSKATASACLEKMAKFTPPSRRGGAKGIGVPVARATARATFERLAHLRGYFTPGQSTPPADASLLSSRHSSMVPTPALSPSTVTKNWKGGA